jgi:acylphosphatase
MDAGVHIVVDGLVQGVGFRWFVATRAKNLNLSGYARNLYDGRVEIEAEGDRSQLEELIRAVRVGPRSAQVRNLQIDWKNPSFSFTHFEIR